MREENNKNALEVSFAVRLHHQKRDAVNAVVEELSALAMMNPSLHVICNWYPKRHGWLVQIHDTEKPMSLMFLLFESVLKDPVYAKEIVLHTFFNFKWELEQRGYIT